MNTPTDILPDHFRLAPSSAYRWLYCPPSAGADGEESEASRLGSLAHEMLTLLLQGHRIEHIKEEIDGRDLSYDPETLEELIRCVHSCSIFVRELPGEIVGLEQRIAHPYIEEHGGTVDVIVYDRKAKTLHIVDYKHGAYEVNATDNAQLKSYMNLARTKYPGAEKFLGTIYQPRVKPGPDTVEYTAAELADHELAIIEASVGTERVAGEHCQWCPLLMVNGTPCPAAFKKLGEQAMQEFEEVSALPIEDRVTALEDIVKWNRVSYKLAKEAKKELIKIAQDGQDLVGLKVVFDWSWTAWDNETTAREYLQKILKSDDLSDFIQPEKLLTPYKVRTLLKKRGLKVAKIPDELTEKHIKGYKLVDAKSRIPRADFAVEFEDLGEGGSDEEEIDPIL